MSSDKKTEKIADKKTEKIADKRDESGQFSEPLPLTGGRREKAETETAEPIIKPTKPEK